MPISRYGEECVMMWGYFKSKGQGNFIRMYSILDSLVQSFYGKRLNKLQQKQTQLILYHQYVMSKGEKRQDRKHDHYF